ncbi:hypothetical protein BTN49_2496 [Candidatus Enterovibrio escicola]|uniref:Uncharacterized protein n=1 Tax=Candidatus Enterovibrio escicola TaxID=1927127 RepID=A0A2A5T1L6_9GAMM|nr:hypothetical protein BTN49_2496 [Candidatus Enterovibrio escacola]
MYYENEIKSLQKLLLEVNRIMPNNKRIACESPVNKNESA